MADAREVAEQAVAEFGREGLGQKLPHALLLLPAPAVSEPAAHDASGHAPAVASVLRHADTLRAAHCIARAAADPWTCEPSAAPGVTSSFRREF